MKIEVMESNNVDCYYDVGLGSFLGPKAENREILVDYINKVLDTIISDGVDNGRLRFHTDDPLYISKKKKMSKQYKMEIDKIGTNLTRLLEYLRDYSVPFYSMRYQDNMIGDTTIPSMLGYFAGMLQNPNNVTPELAPATTKIEMIVAKDICNMIAFPMDKDPWGHLTCDGTIANIEAIWSTREVKCLPIGIKQALINDLDFEFAKDLIVTQPNGTNRRLVELNNWELINLTTDEILNIPKNMSEMLKNSTYKELNEDAMWKILTSRYSLNSIGIVEFTKQYLLDMGTPAIAVPSTKQYSLAKAPALLGIGRGVPGGTFQQSGLLNIYVDNDARMDVVHLKHMIDKCIQIKKPVLSVVVVIGSTQESVVDPLNLVLKLREDYRRKENIDFNIHVDAAFGGYGLSAIRLPYNISWPQECINEENSNQKPFLQDTSEIPLSEYVIDQYKKIREVDSVTIDPHKWGYMPYGAGSLSYRNGKMIKLLNIKAPYIGGSTKLDKTIGTSGVEGSKPGATAAAVFLSHSVVRPDISGHGKIILRSLLNAKLFWILLRKLQSNKESFIVVTIPMLSEEDNKTIFNNICESLLRIPLRDIMKNKHLRECMKQIGPDLNIIPYAFNFVKKDGTINTDVNMFNRFNDLIFEHLSVTYQEKIYDVELIINKTTLYRAEYGGRFIEPYAKYLGLLDIQHIRELRFLRSVIMGHWYADEFELEEKPCNYYTDILIPTLKNTVLKCVEYIREEMDN
ncbi:hypothetical protein H1S01_02935 [Heliobacterium chlorum]|uniref:L-tyrosine decarboxylase C-terminal domain-containing protein n=1 Tax=Heliobacterium chlorum TaxID=2698 RepID=A0ABR7SY58_HELCL|nr:hypothetical protein [Heliobacterium chlorum]MBC9783468.1 hypothetical protein [Heliobacterium chlorum]